MNELLSCSPIVITEFNVMKKKCHFKEPLELVLFYKEEQNKYYLIDESIGIDVYAQTIHELLEELYEELSFLWATYAEGDSNNMTVKAMEIKSNLRALVQ